MPLLLSDFSSLLFENLEQSPNEIPSFKTLEEALRWANDRFTLLNCGSFRCVYDFAPGKVLKVLSQEESANHNSDEIEAFKCLGDLAPGVYDYDHDNYYWILVEKVRPATRQDFNAFLRTLILPPHYEETDINDRKFVEFAKIAGQGIKSKWADELKWWNKNPWFKNVVQMLRKCDVSPEDLLWRNWGWNSQDNLVILDAGGFKLSAIKEGKESLSKLSYLGQCDSLRRKCLENEEFWTEMIAQATPITFKRFLNSVDLSPLLDEDETPEEYVKLAKRTDPGTKAYESAWGDRICMFLDSAGFESIFVK